MSTSTTKMDFGKAGLTMLRRLLVFAVAMSLVLALVPTPALAAGKTFHFSFAGKGAEAGLTTCPFQPAANVVCTDTFVFVAEQVIKEDGTQFSSTTLFIYQFSYKFDRKGNFIFVSERSGFADVTLSIDQKLTSASVSATVPLTLCTVDRKGNFTCTDAGTALVSGAWTGTGDLVRQNGNFHVVSKGFTFNGHFRGQFRDASASVQIDGISAGTQFFADMFDVSDGSVFVCHGDC